MANSERGESEIEIGGKVYKLVPSNEAICELENLLDCSVLEIFDNFMNAKHRMNEIVHIFWVFTKAAEKHSLSHCRDLLDEYGMAAFTQSCFFSICKGISGNKKKDPEVKG